VTLIVPKDRVALSNMNEVECVEMEEGLKKVTFARTPIMSSYLLAFIVGEFDFVEETDSNGVRVRVYTPVGKAEDGKFALNVSCYMSHN
jgi:puromycin-sensitive aminopeptidase